MDTQQKEDFLWCGLTLALTVLVRGLMLDLLPPITTGDMGRDFYASWMVLEGKTPCRDFWWQYGPITPVYYALWFALGGVHLISFHMGLDGIYVMMAFIAFWTLRIFVSPPAAFLTALTYLSVDYGWTFNHIGAIPFLLLGIFSLWKFLLTSRIRWCYLGTLAFVGMALVKINIGPPFFLAFFISILLFNLILYLRGEKELALRWKHLLWLPLIFALGVGGTYLFMYRGLSFGWINQCLTASSVYRTDHAYPFWDNMKHVVMLYFFWERSLLIEIAIYLVLALLVLRSFRKQKLSGRERQMKTAAAGSLVLFFLAGLTEYLMMGENAMVRVNFWRHPVHLLLMGLLGGWTISLFSQPKRVLIYFLVFLWVMGIPLGVIGDRSFLTVSHVLAYRTPEHYLDPPRGRVYAGGGPQQVKSIQTIQKVTQYIRQNTHPSEKILAVPYDPLFCFLSGRRQAIWPLIMTDDHRIPEPYEEEVIRTLERERVRYVTLSNSGPFSGTVNLQKLARYIFENYEEEQSFGSGEPFPAKTLGVKILRRKTS